MLLKKIKDGWDPQEKPGMMIGDTLEVTNAEVLIKLGLAEVVKEDAPVAKVEVKEEPVLEPVKAPYIEDVLSPTPCPNCAKVFKSNASMLKHKRFCDKSFTA